MEPSQGQSGQATLELALTLPVLALLLAALVEVGLVVADQARLWHATREAARVAAVDPDAGEVRAAAERPGLSPLKVEISPAPRMRRQGDPVTVHVTYSPESRVPLFGSLLERVELEATGVMRIEQP
ncbi:MAG: TadE/TadG family type IV pilus assembly protein [Actinomycetota bacterium]